MAMQVSAPVFSPKGLKGLILPRANAAEAAVCDEVEVIDIGTLAEAVGLLTDHLSLEPTCVDIDEVFSQASPYEVDFAEVRGQDRLSEPWSSPPPGLTTC